MKGHKNDTTGASKLKAAAIVPTIELTVINVSGRLLCSPAVLRHCTADIEVQAVLMQPRVAIRGSNWLEIVGSESPKFKP